MVLYVFNGEMFNLPRKSVDVGLMVCCNNGPEWFLFMNYLKNEVMLRLVDH